MIARKLAAAWGIVGVLAILVWACYRLGKIAMEALGLPLGPGHWIALLAILGFMAFFEGYRGFHRAFSPRVVARARHLSRFATPIQGLLAPLFCMGFFHATKRRMLSAYILTATMILLVVIVRTIPQPWRGLIDAGVVLGLLMGCVSILWFSSRVVFGHRFDHPADLPQPRSTVQDQEGKTSSTESRM